MNSETAHIDKNTSSFMLNKWYLDLITSDGNVFILYAATLQWKSFSVNYNSILHRTSGERITHDWWVRGVTFPKISGDKLTLNMPSRKTEGEWNRISPSVQERLIDNEEGTLDWHCVQPSSDVKLMYQGEVYEGKGYAENLKMTIPPWKIGMSALRWGRFILHDDSLVWIKVDPITQWCWYNGRNHEDAVITDDEIHLRNLGIRVELIKEQELESEPKIYNVIKNVGRYLPGFSAVIPLSELMAREVKWLSKGVMFRDDVKTGDSLLIHERVTFDQKN